MPGSRQNSEWAAYKLEVLRHKLKALRQREALRLLEALRQKLHSPLTKHASITVIMQRQIEEREDKIYQPLVTVSRFSAELGTLFGRLMRTADLCRLATSIPKTPGVLGANVYTIYWMIYACLLRRLLQSAWVPEFPNNFRHPCTTMPWTIWPALVVLWGVCWMFWDSDKGSKIYSWPTTGTYPQTDVFGNFLDEIDSSNHAGPSFLRDAADRRASTPFVPSHDANWAEAGSSQERHMSFQSSGLPINDKWPESIPPDAPSYDDSIWSPGRRIAGEQASSYPAVPYTQPNIQAEHQEPPQMLEHALGISSAQQSPYTAVGGLPHKCSVLGCNKEFAVESRLQ